MNGLTESHMRILTQLLVTEIDRATREGRSGPWVNQVRQIFEVVESTPDPWRKVAPVGGEPFGTKVTFWSESWGDRHAIITCAPKVEAERGHFDAAQWQIVIKDGGMTFVPAEMLTLGWHPEAVD